MVYEELSLQTLANKNANLDTRVTALEEGGTPSEDYYIKSEDLIPVNDATYNIGATNKHFKNIYTQNIINSNNGNMAISSSGNIQINCSNAVFDNNMQCDNIKGTSYLYSCINGITNAVVEPADFDVEPSGNGQAIITIGADTEGLCGVLQLLIRITQDVRNYATNGLEIHFYSASKSEDVMLARGLTYNDLENKTFLEVFYDPTSGINDITVR